MSLEEKLQLINGTKQQIRNKIIDRGVYVPEETPFGLYPNYIQQISDPITSDLSDIWEPDPLWWDIKSILENDTNEGTYQYLDSYKKIIILLDDTEPTTSFRLRKQATTSEYFDAVKMSDGTFYQPVNTQTDYVHTWSGVNDKQSSGMYKTRYMIGYMRSDCNVLNTATQGVDSFYDNALSVITECSFKCQSSNNTSRSFQKLRSLIFKNGAEITCSSYAAIWTPRLAYMEIEKYNNDAFPAYFRGNYIPKYVKLLSSAYRMIETSTNGKIYCLYQEKSNSSSADYSKIGSYGECAVEYLDVTDIDFSEVGDSILNRTYALNIIGVIDLSNNTLSNEYFILSNQHGPKGFETDVKIKLPQRNGVSVYLRPGRINNRSIKYLLENAPVITEQNNTLYVCPGVYEHLHGLEPDEYVSYNGVTYKNGLQLLYTKGWQVETIGIY